MREGVVRRNTAVYRALPATIQAREAWQGGMGGFGREAWEARGGSRGRHAVLEESRGERGIGSYI